MLGTGRGLKDAAFSGLGKLATNSVFINPARTSISYKGFPKGRLYNFNNNDIRVLLDQVKEIKWLAPRTAGFGNMANNVVRNERVSSFQIMGDYPATNLINPMQFIQGRFINETDIKETRKVASIGYRVYEEMFNEDEDPIGQYLRINGVYFKIVGVFKSYSTSNNGGENDF